MFVRPSDHIDRTADQRLQGLCATAEIIDGGLDAFFLEEPLALGNGEGEVIEERLAADAEHQFRFFWCRGCILRIGRQARGDARKPEGSGTQQDISTCCSHGFLLESF